MRVALVHLRHRLTGGTERYLQQVAAHLATCGHNVSIVCRSHEAPPHPAVRFMVLRQPALGSAWRLWAFGRAVERHVRAGGYDVVYALGRTWTHDVIRLSGGVHQTYLEVAHPEALRRWPPWRALAGFAQRFEAAMERRALAPGAYERVITNAEMVRRDVMTRYQVPPERVTVIYNGVNLDRFHPTRHAEAAARLRAGCRLDPGDLVVLFLGSGYRRKGLGQLLDAFAGLLDQEPRARLLVVGHESSPAAYVRQAARLGISSRVHFLGGRRDAEVCFAAADLYVLPTWFDAFANSTLEALATGLPVITTDRNGASEVLAHRVNGSILHAVADPAELLGELLFWSEGNRARQASEAARSLAERFPEERTVRASCAMLEEVAAAKRSRLAG